MSVDIVTILQLVVGRWSMAKALGPPTSD